MNQTHHNFDQETKGWVDLIHPREPSKRLTTDLDARWVIVGAGFTGLSCARRLAELNPNEKIILLEDLNLAGHSTTQTQAICITVATVALLY